MPPQIEIVDYDPRWPGMFERERAVIAAALDSTGQRAVIEHVGSTSVPGLAAKPVIDIMAGLDDPAVFDRTGEEPFVANEDRDLVPGGSAAHVAFVRAIQSLGYVYRGEAEIPGRLYFRKTINGTRTHQIHTARPGGSFWNDHLLFRDFLRAHPQWAQLYADTKRKLAVTHGHNRVAYTDAKSPLISELMAKARVWAGKST